jgi:hypothetical protein
LRKQWEIHHVATVSKNIFARAERWFYHVLPCSTQQPMFIRPRYQRELFHRGRTWQIYHETWRWFFHRFEMVNVGLLSHIKIHYI